MPKVAILGGGTFSHVRSHLALAAPAFGSTARWLERFFQHQRGLQPVLHLTKMADSKSKLVTNQDVSALIDDLIADPDTRAIIMSVALCDFDGTILAELDGGSLLGDGDYRAAVPTPSGPHEPRLKTRDLGPLEDSIEITPADKIIGRIRKERKDIFVVGFKTTTGASPDEQYLAGLNLLKENSLNLVLANDTLTRHNMIIAPEETRYFETDDRSKVLEGLAAMVGARTNNTFTRSSVKEGNLYSFQTDLHVPDNLRQVVNHLVGRGAYKAFRGSTAGHFAVRLDEKSCLTSRRKTNYNEPGGLDLVEVEYDGLSNVIAYGAKPSVGGQSQRIVFDEHPDLDCIVHFHCPMRDHGPDLINRAPQIENECGSHQCGANTSRNLRPVSSEARIEAVMLDNHGPNIVFSRTTPPEAVIDFIERNFNLDDKTGGLLQAA